MTGDTIPDATRLPGRDGADAPGGPPKAEPGQQRCLAWSAVEAATPLGFPWTPVHAPVHARDSHPGYPVTLRKRQLQ